MEIEKAIHQKKFASDIERSIVNILYTGSWLSTLQLSVLKEFGISIQQFNLMRILKGQHPEPATVNMLAERMIDKNSNASRIVEKLRSKGLVLRTTCPDDRRRVDIIITETGIELLNQCNKAISKLQGEYDKLEHEEHLELNRLLNKLRS